MENLDKKEFGSEELDKFLIYITTKYKKTISQKTFNEEFKKYFTIDTCEASNRCYLWSDIQEEMDKLGWEEDQNDFSYHNKNYEAPKRSIRVAKGQQSLLITTNPEANEDHWTKKYFKEKN